MKSKKRLNWMRAENAFPFLSDYFRSKGGKVFPDIDLPYQ